MFLKVYREQINSLWRQKVNFALNAPSLFLCLFVLGHARFSVMPFSRFIGNFIRNTIQIAMHAGTNFNAV